MIEPKSPKIIPINLYRLFRVWFLIGLQSFGGGTATLFLIRQTSVERFGWLSAEEFTKNWALVQAAPGINLLCMTILVGRRVDGLVGALVALLGLMLPSVTLTILMTALYADLRNLSVVQAALRGIVPATVGLGLLLTFNMARPLVEVSRSEGFFQFGVTIVILVGSLLAILIWNLPVILVLCGAGVIGGVAMWWNELHKVKDEG